MSWIVAISAKGINLGHDLSGMVWCTVLSPLVYAKWGRIRQEREGEILLGDCGRLNTRGHITIKDS
jgi:hypothetical protein